MKTRFQMMLLLVVVSCATNVLAQGVSIPDPGLNAAIRQTLAKPAGPLTVQDLLSLTNLDASFRGVSSLEGLGAAHNLITLELDNNQLTDFSFLSGLTNLTTLSLAQNQLTNLTLPAGLTSLTGLNLYGNQLTSLTLPVDLTGLTSLYLRGNQLTNFSFLNGFTNLTSLYFDGNQLTDFSFLDRLTNLAGLGLGVDQLTDLSFLSGLTNLITLDLAQNKLTSLTLPAGLTSLTTLYLDDNSAVGGRPVLKTFVLSEQLAVTGLATRVASLRRQGVSVYTYPLTVSLASGQQAVAGAFDFTLTGPPGAYTILGSVDLDTWSELGALTNELGTALFTDMTAKTSLQNFYQARTAR